MDIENHEVICCEGDGEYSAVFVTNYLYNDFCENHLKSETQTNNSHKRQQLK